MELNQNTLFAFSCDWFSFQLNGTNNARRGKFNTNVFFGFGKRESNRKLYKLPTLFWNKGESSVSAIRAIKRSTQTGGYVQRGLRAQSMLSLYFLRFYISSHFDTYRAGGLGLTATNDLLNDGEYTLFVKFGRWQFFI